MRRFWLVPAMLAGAVLYAGFDSGSGLRAWWKLGHELGDSRERIGAQRAEIERLSSAAQDLDGDGFAMEKAIREDLGLARPGEIVVILTGSETSSPRIP